MNASDVWNILKWVLAALAAGFVGHFGRVLAERLIARRRKGEASEDPGRTSPPAPGLFTESIRAQEKIQKKRLKARVKAEKKKGKPSD